VKEKKPKIPDNKIIKILSLLSAEKTWDDITFEAECNRGMINQVKNWFYSIPWLEAKVFAEDNVSILKTRPDYLTNKAKEKYPTDDPVKRHFSELSESALKLSANLEKFLNMSGDNFKSEIGPKVAYGGMIEVDEEYFDLTSYVRFELIPQCLAHNLLSHLKERFLELEKVDDWANLTCKELSYDLIARIRLEVDRQDFSGSCQDCPD